MQKQGWEKVRRKFSDVRAIGITTASEGGMFNRSEMVINLVLRFADAAEYRIKLDPERKVTTEPLTFTRQFLRSLDNSLSGLDFGQPASPRKRRVVEGVLASPNADPLVLETSDPVGAAMTTNERHLELDGALATELQSVASAPPGRSLEL